MDIFSICFILAKIGKTYANFFRKKPRSFLIKDLPKKFFVVAKRSKRMPILLLQHQNRISINGIERSAFTSTITLSPSPLLTAAVFSLLSAKPNFFQILDSVLFDTPKNSDSVHHNVFSVVNVFALEYPKNQKAIQIHLLAKFCIGLGRIIQKLSQTTKQSFSSA